MDQYAVRSVSFTLPASSLVVIVGENGSGKSSVIKLLAQLYQPSSGTVNVDGVDAAFYHLDDLYAAIALLTQDHSIFPLSIAENIALGDVDNINAVERVREAARLGGATEFIEKMKKGYNEFLRPVSTWQGCMYPLPDGPLKKFADEIERRRDVSGAWCWSNTADTHADLLASGGEKQRLAA